MKGGVLVGRPLVEEADRPGFEAGGEQGQPPPLPLRQVDGREGRAVEPDHAIEFEAVQQVGGALQEVRRVDPADLPEEVAVGEDHREQLAVRLGSRPGPMTRPSSVIRPESGSYSPANSFIRVVLPLPLPPATKTTSPARIVRSTGPRAKPSRSSLVA